MSEDRGGGLSELLADFEEDTGIKSSAIVSRDGLVMASSLPRKEGSDEDTYGDNTADSVLHHITWKIPERNDLIHYDVSSEFQCYTIKRKEGMAYRKNPVEELRSYVNMLANADRILETKVFEGKECVGFEIKSSFKPMAGSCSGCGSSSSCC